MFLFAVSTALLLGSLITALVGGGAGIVSAVSQKHAAEDANATNIRLQQEANAFSAEEAQKNRDWQEEMSNTAIQRQMNDLQAAGLNPALAANYSGASTPSGSYASAQAAQVKPAGLDLSGLTSAMNSASNLLAWSAVTDKRVGSWQSLHSAKSASSIASSGSSQAIAKQTAEILKDFEYKDDGKPFDANFWRKYAKAAYKADHR